MDLEYYYRMSEVTNMFKLIFYIINKINKINNSF